MPNIFIRVDSSIKIGSGHVMRCLTLAECLRKDGANIFFISREHDGNMCNFISSKGFEVIRFSSPNNNTETSSNNCNLAHSHWLGVTQSFDAKETIQAIEKHGKADMVIVDHYALDYRWEKIVKSSTNTIMVIDDLADRKHNCDVLLDQNFYEDYKLRYNGLVPDYCELLLGPSYILLREEFTVVKDKIGERDGSINRLLVFLGGSDPTNETEKVIDALLSNEFLHLKVDVIVGVSNPNAEKIKGLVELSENLYFHSHVSNMAEMMGKADLFIGAGGSTTWERCFLGLPSIVINIAMNQGPISNSLANRNALINLGNAHDLSPLDIKNAIIGLLSNNEKVKQLSNNSFQLVDGKGVKRVSECIWNHF